jgi:peptide-methionine (R)-S-oxide reductase
MSVQKSEDEWQKQLTPEQYRVLRLKGTEAPFSGKYDLHFENGQYQCAACGAELFDSNTKFSAHCGWPSFYNAKPGAVKLSRDSSLGMERTEVTCANCGGHLGHLFKGEGFNVPTDQRFCINSVSLNFKKH